MKKGKTKGTVAVLGASNKLERYSNKAVRLLKENGYNVVPIHPMLEEIEGFEVVPDLESIKESIHTLSLYVNPEILSEYISGILKLKPARVIMNPGTESDDVQKQLEDNGISVLKACTLVLLRTGQFEKVF